MKRLGKRRFQYKRHDGSERLFIGILPPLNLTRILAKNKSIFSKETRNLNFVPEDQLHITIKFLGPNISEDSKQQIIEVLNNIVPHINAPEIKILDLSFGFKGQLTPNVIFYYVEATKELKDLGSIIHEKIKALELSDVKREKDYRKLSYHLTIARCRHHSYRAYGRKIRALIKEKAVPIEETFIPEELCLIRSKLINGTHTKYEVIKSFAFKK